MPFIPFAVAFFLAVALLGLFFMLYFAGNRAGAWLAALAAVGVIVAQRFL